MKIVHLHQTLTLVYAENYNGSVIYGASFCSPKDQFCKRTGREQATKRMTGEKAGYCGVISGHNDVVLRCLADMLVRGLHPEHADLFLRLMIGL